MKKIEVMDWLTSKGFFDWMPDEMFLKLRYRKTFHKALNLKNPKTFSEKLQWLKLYDRKPEYTRMVDKYEAKKYAAERIGKEYIIPTLGVWNRFDEIDFDHLPGQFVLKCTHDSGGLVICRDKSKLDTEAARKKIEKSLKTNYYLHGREWPYKNVKPRIIAEPYMEDDAAAELRQISVQPKQEGLTDYKFYCFDGKPEFLYISRGLEDHATARISFVDLNWQPATYKRSDYKPFEVLPPKPQRFDEMIDLAKKLSKGHAFLRVDLYQADGRIYFSELTFFPCSGFLPLEDHEHDAEIGRMIKLPL